MDRRLHQANGMMQTATSGQQIARYIIDRKLTEGDMAEVYLAHYAAGGFDRPVVLKSLLPGLADNRELVARVRDEARLAARLSHPNIAGVEDLVEVGGRPFIVMEYLDGQNLRQIVHRALRLQYALSLAFVCRVVACALGALEHVHALCDGDGRPLGVHRCVSPANVIVTWSGRVALIDFGTANGEILKRECAYLSPEQVRAAPLDRRSDLFSVGVILWEMLTQRRLFARRAELYSMMSILSQDAPSPRSIAPELPDALDVICGKALARDREQRYQTAGEMRRDLEALIATEGWRASPSDLRVELAALFPGKTGKAERSPYDDEERPTTPSSWRVLVTDVPRAAPPMPVTSTSLRPADVAQRLPRRSANDDGSPPRRHARWLWLATLFVCGIVMLLAFAAARVGR